MKLFTGKKRELTSKVFLVNNSLTLEEMFGVRGGTGEENEQSGGAVLE